ncbi:MAG TPA: flagellar basal body-associated FliL family protein [Solirubrobacter sp.]|nr:flagellar basal body-associated FliL family protein [Solirubrobacter sp.]
MVKKLAPIIALLAVLGGAYKFVLAKPATAGEAPKPKVEGTVYMLQKEFLVNLADGRFAKLQIGLVLAHDDTSTEAAGGHEGGATPPEGYGPMTQEGVVRDVITGVLTDAKDSDLIVESGRERLKTQILKELKRHTDVKVEHVLFSDLTVQ